MNILRLCTFFLIFTCTSIAYASECLFDRCFIGVEFERQWPVAFDSITIGNGLPEVSKNFLRRFNSGYTIDVGYRFYDMGFRLGYTYSQEVKYNAITLYNASGGSVIASGDVTQKINNVFVDWMYFYKYAPRMELKFLLGVGGMWTSFRSTLTGTYTGSFLEKYFSPGFRIGLGPQYQINSCLVGDLMVKCQVPGNDAFKYVVSLSIGLSYYI